MPHHPLGDISVSDFLSHYWQQKPCIIRQAFPDIQSPISAEELAGIACEQEANGRLVMEHGETPWQVKYSPLTDNDFTSLPDQGWTLLVNDMEAWLPELQAIYQAFGFIPQWRMDDLMISYATDQGSVGAHIDQYDVFLLQLEGRREWQVSPPHADHATGFIPDIELNILSQFAAQQTWTLETGDMLYLPPKWAHHGIAQGHCFTLSVGFRAPNQRDLFESWVNDSLDKHSFDKRFSDAGRNTQAHGEFSQQDRQQLRTLLRACLQEDDASLDHWLGNYLSESKHDYLGLNRLLTDEQSLSEIEQWLQAFNQYYQQDSQSQQSADALTELYRPTENKLLWFASDEAQLTLFACGKPYPLPLSLQPLIEYLCQHYVYDESDLATSITQEQLTDAMAVLKTLLKHQVLQLNTPDDDTL